MTERELALFVCALVAAGGISVIVWGVRALRRIPDHQADNAPPPTWRQLAAIARVAKRSQRRIPNASTADRAAEALNRLRRRPEV